MQNEVGMVYVAIEGSWKARLGMRLLLTRLYFIVHLFLTVVVSKRLIKSVLL